MADEPRRSGRPTKGQHTKMDLLDVPTDSAKKKGGKKGKKQAAQEEEEDEVIRCVCGATATAGPDDPEPWIACDNCGVWQHNVCVGIPTYDDEIPDNYLCEECGPRQHKELLDNMARGERIWEDRRRAYERRQAEEEASKKKGKKGKKRASEIDASNGKAKSPSVPVEPKKERKETPVRTGSTKRKTRDESHEKESAKENPAKSRKVSTAHSTPKQKSPPSNLPPIDSLEKIRQGPAKLIYNSVIKAIPIAVNRGVYAYSPGDTLETKSERLAAQIEDAVFRAKDPGAYVKQIRTVGANLKQNQELCNNLLTKRLSFDELANMSSDDMMTKDLAQKTAEMKALADKQAVMVTDDGPRVRRTHKGEEMVEGDNFSVHNDSMMSASRRRSLLDPNGEMASRSRENSPGDEVELRDNINDHRSHDDIRGNAMPRKPLNIETKPKPAPMRKASTKDFDFNQVMSSVQSPTGPTSHVRRPSGYAPPTNGPGEDADVDRLLEDDNSSPPYSPQEYDSDPDIVWRGTVNMDSIAKFPAVARHIGGADLTKSMDPPVPYDELLSNDLKIAGRIAVEQANDYLCGLRYAPSVDVVMVSVTPTGERAAEGFRDIFEYFYSKGRYGVLANKGAANIRDTYLVPIAASPAPLPDYVTNLEGHKIPENRPDPMLLVTLVVRTQWIPDHERSFDSQTDPNSPLQSLPQRQISMSGTGPSMSPIAPQGSFSGSVTGPTPYPPQQSPDEAQRRAQEEQRYSDQIKGEATAARILGPHIHAPTVAFLIPQAFQMRELEWEVIRDILASDERSRGDLQHLSQVLEERMKHQPPA